MASPAKQNERAQDGSGMSASEWAEWAASAWDTVEQVRTEIKGWPSDASGIEWAPGLPSSEAAEGSSASALQGRLPNRARDKGGSNTGTILLVGAVAVTGITVLGAATAAAVYYYGRKGGRK
jgi:hypothetical protein